MTLKEKYSDAHLPKHHQYNPFEVAICGFSNSGKTTLIGKLIDRFKKSYAITYVKSDAHGIQMDKEGKDTFRVYEAGADRVFIKDSYQSAQITRHSPMSSMIGQDFSDSDMVIVEGHKNAPIPKVVVVDADQMILAKIKSGEISNILALVGSSDSGPDSSLNYFHRDDVEGIARMIEQHFQARIAAQPLYGMILTGGKSKRMGRDKALLQYSEKKQIDVCLDLLARNCNEVFVSTRPQQSDRENLQGYLLEDSFLGFGPLGGILTGLHRYREASWLVIACDLPFLDQSTIDLLIQNRDPFRYATCFENQEKGFPEPLCTIYEPKSYGVMLNFLSKGFKCPRRILEQIPIQKISTYNSQSLKNVNTDEEFHFIKNQMSEVGYEVR